MRQLFCIWVAWLTLGGLVVFTGCAAGQHAHRSTKAEATPAPTPLGPQRVGTIALVNTDLHFVLVDVGSLYTPQAGMALKSFSAANQETGILAVSKEKQRPFIVADIIKGTPQVGDEVRE
jgi:hypothetical protein